jgi:hypothetical protein
MPPLRRVPRTFTGLWATPLSYLVVRPDRRQSHCEIPRTGSSGETKFSISRGSGFQLLTGERQIEVIMGSRHHVGWLEGPLATSSLVSFPPRYDHVQWSLRFSAPVRSRSHESANRQTPLFHVSNSEHSCETQEIKERSDQMVSSWHQVSPARRSFPVSHHATARKLITALHNLSVNLKS